jgi:AAA domain/Domain of unknown function (DUF3854)
MPNLSPPHLNALLKRGMDAQTMQQAGLYSATRDDARQIVNNPKIESAALVIPFLHPETGAVRLRRVRPDTPAIIDGKPAKYLSPRGAGNFLYFPPQFAERLRQQPDMLYITEGEFKALIAWQYGFNCLGLIGVWGWREKSATKQSRPIADLDLIDWQDRVVCLVFDSDLATNPEVKRARQALAKELYHRGAGEIYGAFPPSEMGEKVGFDDFLVKHGREAFFVLDDELLPPTDLPMFTSPISELLNTPEEPIEWAIESLLPLGANGWRIAAPKVGKSWDMLQEVYCLSTAQPLYGHFRVPQQRRVMLIEEEDPRRRIKRRLERIIHAHGGKRPDDAYFRYAVKKGVRLDDPAWQEVIDWEVRSFRPAFLYLDVFTRLHTSDINDQVAMTKIISFLDSLNREYDCAVEILHHNRKTPGDNDEHDEILGSRVLGGFAEVTLFFKKLKERGMLRVKVIGKDEPDDDSFEPEFLIKLTDTADQRGTSLVYQGLPPEHMRVLILRDKVKQVVIDAGDWVTVKQVADLVKCSKPLAQQVLELWYALGVCEKETRGRQTQVYRALTATANTATANTANGTSEQ